MDNFSLDRDGGADVRPARYLANGEHIAINQTSVSVGVARHRLSDRDVLVFAQNLVPVLHDVAREVRRLRVSAALESTGNLYQVAGGHVFSQQVFSGPLHLSRDDDRGG